MPSYSIARLNTIPVDFYDWDGPAWNPTKILSAAAFRPESADHRPLTEARLGYQAGFLHGMFKVQDQYVRCVHTRFQDHTHLDSCVELFVQPKPGMGYFNFEFNCGGCLAVFYITDHTRTPDGFAAFTYLTPEDISTLKVYPSLPPVVEPEIASPLTWTLGFSIPTNALERYIGELGPLSGQTWRANVYKCGDQTSQPHWAAWAPVTELNFHQPNDFGIFSFE